MTTLREAAQQALEALDSAEALLFSMGMTASSDTYQEVNAAIIALRAALEQPEQEPVAWIDDSEHPKHRLYRQSATEQRLYGPLRPLYAHPPRREWRSLTEEEIRDLWSWSATAEAERTATTQQHAFARAIEAALKERNA